MTLAEDLLEMERNTRSTYIGKGDWLVNGDHALMFYLNDRSCGTIDYKDSYVKHPFKWEATLPCEARYKEMPQGYTPTLKAAKTIVEVLAWNSMVRDDKPKKVLWQGIGTTTYAVSDDDVFPPAPTPTLPSLTYASIKQVERVAGPPLGHGSLQFVQQIDNAWSVRIPQPNGSFRIRLYQRVIGATNRYSLADEMMVNDASGLTSAFVPNQYVTALGARGRLYSDQPYSPSAAPQPTPQTPLNTNAPALETADTTNVPAWVSNLYLDP
jgi:hypothetical protein